MAKLKIPNILAVPVMVAGVVAVAFLVYFIARWAGAYAPQIWGAGVVFGTFAAVSLFVWIRQIYWKITKKGDYEEFPKKEE
jgi:hypothetical protein